MGEPSAARDGACSNDAMTTLLVVESGRSAAAVPRGSNDEGAQRVIESFDDPSSAIAFALEAAAAGSGLRIAVHTGGVMRASALCSVAHGGQVLVSSATAGLVAGSLPDGATLRDLGPHRLKDLGPPEDIRQLCHPTLPDTFPPLFSFDQLPHNLPAELTSFVGRLDELRAVGSLVAKERLVTLAGAGGCGKTRLALHAGADAVEEMTDGVWLADLATVMDRAFVGRAVAGALSVSEQAMQSPEQAIAARLRAGRALVILDNCEHLVEPVAGLVQQLLNDCPGVRVLCTSREPLGIEGEVVHRVPSLGLPESDADASCESVELFVERARAVRPSFVLDAAILPAVAEVCRRTDGLPLAIELAAARIRLMSPLEISEQLEDRFRLLSAGRRGALARQQTLEASVQWSYDLLTEPERRLFRRLSVFAGGFSLGAASIVGAADGSDGWQVVDVLSALVDRSLVQVEEVAGRSRYRLLETLRSFASLRLAEVGEVDDARDRHLAAVGALAAAAEQALVQRADGRFLAQLSTDVENLRAALEWATDTGRTGPALRIFADTGLFWNLTRPTEGLQWALVLEGLPGGDPQDRGRALGNAVLCALAVGDLAAAARFHDETNRIAGQLDDDFLSAIAAVNEVQLGLVRGDANAAAIGDRGAELAARIGNVLVHTMCLTGSGVALTFSGELAGAADHLDRAVALCRTTPHHVTAGLVLELRGLLAMISGDFELAQGLLASLPTDGWSIASRSLVRVLEEVYPSWLLSAQGRHADVMAGAAECVASARRLAEFATLAFAGWIVPWLAWRAGEAPDEVLMAQADWVMAGLPVGLPVVRALRAELALADGDVDAAGRHLEAAFEITKHPMARLFLPFALTTSARAALASGEFGRAEDIAHQALSGCLSSGLRWGVPEVLDVIAVAQAHLGAGVEAARLAGAATAMRESIPWARGVHEEEALGELRRLAEFESAYGQGRAMSWDEAVAYATRMRGERKRPAFGWESLTPSEQAVAHLAAEGLRNAEIAEKLFITVPTVKTHLAHVYSKVGVRTRAGLAALVHQRS